MWHLYRRCAAPERNLPAAALVAAGTMPFVGVMMG
jgi:hypothetical protein